MKRRGKILVWLSREVNLTVVFGYDDFHKKKFRCSNKHWNFTVSVTYSILIFEEKWLPVTVSSFASLTQSSLELKLEYLKGTVAFSISFRFLSWIVDSRKLTFSFSFRPFFLFYLFVFFLRNFIRDVYITRYKNTKFSKENFLGKVQVSQLSKIDVFSFFSTFIFSFYLFVFFPENLTCVSVAPNADAFATGTRGRHHEI